MDRKLKFLQTKIIPALIVVDCARDAKDANEIKLNKPNNPLICRPVDLPLYPEEKELDKQEIRRQFRDESGPFEHLIKTFRSKTNEITTTVASMVDSPTIDTYKHEFQSFITYLKEEENIAPRIGAIATAGLAGFIFGMRRSFFKKTIYSAAAALAMTSLCYPDEAADFSRSLLHDTRKTATITYNFIFGATPSKNESSDDFRLHMPSFLDVQQSFDGYSDQLKKKFGYSANDESKLYTYYDHYPITRHSPASSDISFEVKEKSIRNDETKLNFQRVKDVKKEN